MSVRQLSIFLENRVGRLDSVIQTLGNGQVNILAISLADTESFGIVRVLVDQVEAAVKLLQAKNIVCKLNEVVVVAVDTVPGSLGRTLAILSKSGVNVEYMYAVAQSSSSKPLMVFSFDERVKGQEALRAAGAVLLDEQQLLSGKLP